MLMADQVAANYNHLNAALADWGCSHMARTDSIRPAQCAQQLSALASPDRLKIVRFLRSGPHNVTEIAEMLRTQLVNVSHHVTILRLAGIISGEKRGRFVY